MLKDMLSSRLTGKSKLKYREIISKIIAFIAEVANMLNEHSFYWYLVRVLQGCI